MRFFAQIGLTALVGGGLTIYLEQAIPNLTGWSGAVIFWLAFFLGMTAGAEVAYLLARFIPEPPPPPREQPADEPTEPPVGEPTDA